MTYLLWVPVLLAAVWAAHWGAEHLSAPLRKLRQKWGISVAAGGALIGLAAASPEVGIATSAAMRGVSDIGLGSSVGSNVIAIPIMVVTAYLATRKRRLGEDQENDGNNDGGGEGGGSAEHEGHERHLREHALVVDRQAVTVQALPYLGLVALFAALTLPAPWRGLQPLDAALLGAGYLAYAAQALLRGRGEGEDVDWPKKEVALAVGGVAALVAGAYFTVLATENIVSGLGIEAVVGGLFITAPMAALPEVFATWSVTRSGQVTPAVTSVIGDHAVTLTLSFVPLALATLPAENFRLFAINLVGVALVAVLYAAFVWVGGREKGFQRWQVVTLAVVAPLWVVAVIFWGL
ncbi:MAG: sodium:calcium exchanger [Rhodothermales bacterium]|jgi:cation:H+ antiporter